MRTRIKEFRARKNMTQEELAEKVGVARQTILLIENGTYNPSLLLALKIVNKLESSIEETFIIEKGDLK